MGIIKTFGEWLNESVSSVKTLTNNVYQALVDAGFGNDILEPEYNSESPFLTAQADAFGFDITTEVDCIHFSESSTFDYDKYIFYGIYVTDEAPINDEGGTASIIIEYGEDDYTDGPEPWVFYYSAKADHWDGNENGPIDGNANNVNPDLLKLIATITPIVNPRTKFTAEYLGFDNEGHTLKKKVVDEVSESKVLGTDLEFRAENLTKHLTFDVKFSEVEFAENTNIAPYDVEISACIYVMPDDSVEIRSMEPGKNLCGKIVGLTGKDIRQKNLHRDKWEFHSVK